MASRPFTSDQPDSVASAAWRAGPVSFCGFSRVMADLLSQFSCRKAGFLRPAGADCAGQALAKHLSRYYFS
ncbi:MAG: hypothetical protein BroJett024_11340 [Alphaproteobacteria bacterium]|nr:MAG: hypothetical protein BroJett024_11340 [Alphaproteobacteria bacterium]